MVTSGKSSRRAVSTAPIVRRGVRASATPFPDAPAGAPGTGSAHRVSSPGQCTASAAGGLAGARAGQVDEAELADLHLVTAGQGRDVDRLAVDVGAVEAADVVHREAAALARSEERRVG